MIQLPPISGEVFMETFPIHVQGGATVPARLYVCDDNSCIYFGGNDTITNCFGFHAFVIDGATQAITWYATVRNADQPNFTAQSIVPFGNGFFSVTLDDGSNYFFQAQNLKLNNGSPIPIFKSQNQIANDCWSPFSRAYFDGATNLLGAGFYTTNDKVFSSTYLVGATGLDLLAQGFVGFINDGDPWDQTSGTPANPTQLQRLSNGLSFAWGGNNPLWTARETFSVLPGVNIPNDCVALTPNLARVTTSRSNTLFTNPNILGFGGVIDTNLFGLGGVYMSSGGFVGLHIFGDNNTWFYIPSLGARLAAAVTKNFTFIDVFFANNHWISISESRYGANGFYNGYSIGGPLPWTLVNNARPISLTGKYKA